MITLVDYGAGNVASVRKAFTHLGYVIEVTSDPAVVARAERLVLPGVGHFRATAALQRSGVQDAIAAALRRGAPFLGICVGMQWMFAGSDEAPDTPGLSAFTGRCGKFPAEVKAPHVGWNTVRRCRESRLLQGAPETFFVYYTHSYRIEQCQSAIAATEYGSSFTAAVERDNVFGVQFHPEKSGASGLLLLDNFGRLSC